MQLSEMNRSLRVKLNFYFHTSSCHEVLQKVKSTPSDRNLEQVYNAAEN